ncbi:uncharacterized membrane protein YhaH (DUF805 family) [Cryobacterium mesophilum]|jgi:hypothetical protein|uniref:Uncharacterized protein n=1 Tax=Terrimesophilobacter mesophilus TaxID=433647 RepID=A0A4R8VAG0_9MICO|nr:hypothetical protein [Terrimesophilobacter mesophilus]MBB5633470.1 uncharacterized membrane protein YhaH (DUF805 family) [Terrimesophilobacter mesophilus]TFB80184.1 hypothetical protein E3N84_09140 [Terrimesophilobacter mesophilus]
MSRSENRDSTRIGDQPALRTSRGATWLIVGGLLAALSIGLLVALDALQPPVGLIGAAVLFVLYMLMVVAVLAIPVRRAKLVTLAGLMVAMAVVALVFVVAINVAEWSAVR